MIETVFIVFVGFLLILACIDLFVGVSNDAVNFLNSAVGCRIAPLKIILIVASLGVLCGSTFSSGMMALARNGMFRPEMFTFYDVMLIFLGVVVADVLLLNIFNSLGLPTSTTVSIVFELLGASVCAAAVKISADDGSLISILEYIKSDKAMTIVSAILISVVVAFFSGAMIQFLLRILFTFKLRNTYKYYGGIFCGFSLTAIFYFLVMKGAKGASFMKPEYIDFINHHTTAILWSAFILFSVIGQLMVMRGQNVFKLIILSGTFALAFSFAGNDLVNFIGVPLAALNSLMYWMEFGDVTNPHAMIMDSLNGDVPASTWQLAAAGIIMVLTLWFSKKARKVIQTSINLSSSTRGDHEQFGASMPGRMVTRFGLGVSRTTIKVMPAFMLAFFAKRYEKDPVVKGEIPLPFDYVRASLNLVLASILIASATSLKLPLSTTYVTFMVAMGSSFADGAWNRESAVYRISGVIAVIAGWFLTGMCAFMLSMIITLCFFSFSYAAMFVLTVLAIFVVIRSNFSNANTPETVKEVIEAKGDNKKIFESVSRAVPGYFDAELDVAERVLNNFFEDNEIKLRSARNKAVNIEDEISRERSGYYTLALDRPSYSEHGTTVDAQHFFFLAFSTMREAAKAMRFMSENAVTHIANRHTIFEGEMKENLFLIKGKLHMLAADIRAIASGPTGENVETMVKRAKKINRDIDKAQIALVSTIANQHVSMHSAEMYLGFLQAFRDLTNRYVAVAMQSRALSQIVEGSSIDKFVDDSQLKTQVLGSASRTVEGGVILEHAVASEDEESAVNTADAAEEKAAAEESAVNAADAAEEKAAAEESAVKAADEAEVKAAAEESAVNAADAEVKAASEDSAGEDAKASDNGR